MDNFVFSSSKLIETDTVDSYFECISECNIINGHRECITRCLEKHLKGGTENE